MPRNLLEWNRAKLGLFVPVVLGVAIRLAFLLATAQVELWADEAKYVYLAVAWDRFDVLLGSTNWLWPPGYPIFLGFFLSLFGDAGVNAAKLGQVLLSGVVGASVVLIAQRVFCRRAAQVAGYLWALYLPLIGFTHLLWPETLLLAVLLPAVYLYIGVLQSPDPGAASRLRLVASGLLFGLACLVKQVALAVPFLFSVGLLFHSRQGRVSKRLLRAAFLLLATATVVVPWGLRNAEVYDRWVFGGATAGQNAWLGVNSVYRNFDYSFLAQERYLDQHPVNRWLLKAPPQSFWKRSKAPNLIDRSSENFRQGREFAHKYPGYYLRTRVKKLADWATPYSFFIRHFRLNLYTSPLTGDGLRQVLILASLLASMVVLFGAIPGLLWCIQERVQTMAFLSCLIAVLAPVWVTSMSRYRTPVEPLLLVLAAGFLTGINRPWPRKGLATGLVLCGWLLLAGLWLTNSQEILWELQELL